MDKTYIEQRDGEPTHAAQVRIGNCRVIGTQHALEVHTDKQRIAFEPVNVASLRKNRGVGWVDLEGGRELRQCSVVVTAVVGGQAALIGPARGGRCSPKP